MEDTELLQLVSALVATLPKPRGATAGRLQRLLDPCVTIKLDGTRALLVWDGRNYWSHTVLGAERLQVETKLDRSDWFSAFSALDAELIDSHFYVFDALFVKGVDVRHLPLMNRLREARAYLPPCASMKRYYYGSAPSLIETVKKLERSKPKMADGNRLDSIEGFILGSLNAPYEWAPLKFKYSVTYDFVVASTDAPAGEAAGARRLWLYAQKDQQLTRFEGREGAPGSVLLKVSELERLGLPSSGIVEVEQGIVLELKLVEFQWKLVRMRKDRQRPNSFRTIEENLELQRGGKCTTDFLLEHLHALHSAKSIVRNVTNAMMRALGISGAVLMGHAIPVLLMPTHSALQRELGEPPERSRGVIVAIVPSISTKLALGERRWSSSALALNDVVKCCKRSSWTCRFFTALRPQDFLCGNAFPTCISTTLNELVFLILRRVAGIYPP